MIGLKNHPSIRIFAALALAWAAAVAPVAAQYRTLETAKPGTVPTGMNYQGRLEKDGFPVTGDKVMRFKLFDVAADGTALWDSGDTTVTVTQGIFAEVLAIPTSALNGTAQRYLEVTVDGITLLPRDPIRTVPYAAIAETVEGDIEISTAGLSFQVGAIAALVISSITSNIGIGSTNSPAQFSVTPQSDDSLIVQISSQDASAVMVVDNRGFMGLGTNSPGELMDARSSGNALLRLHADSDNNSGNQDAGVVFVNNTNTQTGQIIYDESADIVTMGYGAANQHLNIDNTGRVGIGTIAPGTTFDVNGSAQFGSGGAKSTFTATGALQLNTSAGLSVGTTFFVGNGRVGVGTASPQAKTHILNAGTAATPAAQANTFLRVQNSAAGASSAIVEVITGAQGRGQVCFGDTASACVGSVGYDHGSNRLALGANGTSTFMTIDSAGSVGVGTQVPATTLDVAGSAQFGNAGTKSGFTTGGTLNMASGANIAISGAGKVTQPAAPTAGNDLTNRTYVDSHIGTSTYWSLTAGSMLYEKTAARDVGIGTNDPMVRLHVIESGTAGAGTVDTIATFQKSSIPGESGSIDVVVGATGNASLNLGNTGGASRGIVLYNNNTETLGLGAGGTPNQLTISGGAVSAIGTLTLNDNDSVSGDVNLVFGDANETGNIQNVANIYDDTGTNSWLEVSGCGTGATLTAVNALGTLTCSSISITQSQISDLDADLVDLADGTLTFSKVGAATANRATQFGAGGALEAASVTTTELGRLTGITGNVQTLLNGKLALAGGTMTGAVAMGSNKITGVASATASGDALHFGQILAFDSNVSLGSAAIEVMTVTGLAATDTILAVTQKTAGANNTAITSFSTLAADKLTIGWTGDPGAGAVVTVTVKR